MISWLWGTLPGMEDLLGWSWSITLNEQNKQVSVDPTCWPRGSYLSEFTRKKGVI